MGIVFAALLAVTGVVNTEAASQTPAAVGPGGISGVVHDSSGGVMPGVTVKATSAAVPDRTTITNARGRFAITDLPAGLYTVTISVTGFKTSTIAVPVGDSEIVSTNVVLAVGTLQESVSVHAAPVRPAAEPVSSLSAEVTSAAYFDLAKQYYEQGRLAEAGALTTRALELLQIEKPDEPAAARATVDAAGAIRVGGAIQEPRKIRHVQPIYPAEALAAGVEGLVILEAIVSRNGTVGDVRILRSVPMLDEAALGAVRLWQFTPTLLNRAPIEVVMMVTVRFER
jgi:TonB family protein